MNAGGTLSGGSAIIPGLAGPVTVNPGGTFAPGKGIGQLNTGALSMATGAIFHLEFDTTGGISDLAVVGGDFNLSASNDVVLTLSDLSPAQIISGSFPFVSYSAWNGGLFTVGGMVIDDYDALLNPGAQSFTVSGNTYQIDYDANGNTVALIAVPEPSAALSLLGGLGLLTAARRARRRA